jgi:hypothetical protein
VDEAAWKAVPWFRSAGKNIRRFRNKTLEKFNDLPFEDLDSFETMSKVCAGSAADLHCMH